MIRLLHRLYLHLLLPAFESPDRCEAATDRGKKVQKSDQNGRHFRLDCWSLGTPKFTKIQFVIGSSKNI